MPLPFALASPGFLLLAIPAVLSQLLSRTKPQALGHTDLRIHRNLGIPLTGRLPSILMLAALLLLTVALARPQLIYSTTTQTVDAVDTVIVVDISGSMFTPELADSNASTGGSPPMAIQVAQKAIHLFLNSRDCARTGLMVFDDTARLHWPLSTDCKIIGDKVDLLDKYSGGGTNFDGPTASDPSLGALQGGLNLLTDMSQSTARVFIMVTDGDSSIDKTRFQQIAAQFKQMGVKLYILGVGADWVNGRQLDLRDFAKAVGGQIFPVGDSQAMLDGFARIAAITKQPIKVETHSHGEDLYMWFVLAGLACISLAKLIAGLMAAAV